VGIFLVEQAENTLRIFEDWASRRIFGLKKREVMHKN
jgi:hypothetical protein